MSNSIVPNKIRHKEAWAKISRNLLYSKTRTLQKSKYFQSLILATTLIFAGGCKELSITKPAEGEFITSPTTNIAVDFSSEKESQLEITLNGAEVTDQFTMTEGTATSETLPLLGDLNVITASSGGETITRRFAHYANGYDDSVISPLGTGTAFGDLIKSRYDYPEFESTLTLAERLEYPTEIAIPFEIIFNQSLSAAIAQLHDTDAPTNEKTYVVSLRFYAPGYGFIVSTALWIHDGQCRLRIISTESEDNFDLCSQSQLERQSIFNYVAPKSMWNVPGPSNPNPSCGQNALMTQILNLHIEVFKGVKACKSIFSCSDSIVSVQNAGTDTGSIFGTCITVLQPYPDTDEGLSASDPHMITLDKVMYGNQMIGEFVLSRDKLENRLEIQTRQQDVFPHQCVTGNTAIAIQLDSNRIEYRHPKYLPSGEKPLLLNGIQTELAEGEVFTFPNGTTVRFQKNYGGRDQYLTKSAFGYGVSFYKIFGHINISVHANDHLGGNLEGLLGNYDGSAENDFILRSGIPAENDVSFIENWRLFQEESLFTYPVGIDTNDYTEETNCSLSPTTEAIDLAKSIYFRECGSHPKLDDPLINSIALDLTAGINEEEVLNWFSGVCSSGTKQYDVEGWVKLNAPNEQELATEFEVSWYGPNNEGDQIVIVPSGSAEDAVGNHAFPSTGNPLRIDAPVQLPGQYELRYISGLSDRILASVPIEITPSRASIETVEEAQLGSWISVSWQGPDNDNDFITIVPTGSSEGVWENYTYTNSGNPLWVKAPVENPGQYEVRYVTGQDHKTLTSKLVELTPITASLETIAQTELGSQVLVSWQGPNNDNDFITIVPAGSPHGVWINYTYTTNGNPLWVTAPIEPPGQYEVRYVTGQGYITLASRLIELMPLTVSLEAAAQAQIGSQILVSWQGPNYHNDFMTLVPIGSPEGTWGNYTYTSNGDPLSIDAPLENPGYYEIRYVTAQGRKTLKSRQIEIVDGG